MISRLCLLRVALPLVAHGRSEGAILSKDVPPQSSPYNLAVGVWFLRRSEFCAFRLDLSGRNSSQSGIGHPIRQ
jgi:hypothetical protein